MKVWIDISNAPHVIFFRSLIKELKVEGHEVLVTARDYGPIFGLLRMYKIKFIPVGEHGGKDVGDKLLKSAERTMELGKLIRREKPDICIYKYSIEAARVAFGLGIPSIAVADNEYGFAQNMLTLPFANKVVIPKAIMKKELEKYGVMEDKLVQFDGVCEVANVRGFKPVEDIFSQLGLSKAHPLVVLRPEPYLASYYGRKSNFLEPIIRKLNKDNKKLQIVIIPRSDMEKALEKKFRNVKVIEKAVDALSLSHNADLVVSAGGTMNREAALLGTPTISCFPEKFLAVDRYLVAKGLMKYAEPSELLKKKLRVEKKKAARKKIIMEDPVNIIKREMKKLVK